MAHHVLGKRLLVIGAVASATAMTFAGMPNTAHAAPHQLGKLSDYTKIATDNGMQLSKNRWYVQTDGAPVAKGGNAAANKAKHENVKNSAASNGITIKVDSDFTDLWNGMAVTVNDSDVPALASLPGVTKVFPIVQVSMPRDQQGNPTDVSSQVMTGVNVAQQQYGLTGKGIKVGVIDSGIDLDHPDLGGNGIPGQAPFPNRRVKYGYDFVGDKYDSAGKYGSTTPVPDAVPDDCGGHGSHVAGIIGADGDPAKGGVRGIAPEVTFGAYRVFGCEGSVDDDIIIKAMEMAGRDGMNIVNMSLGWSLATWPDYPQALAADSLADKGTIVVDAMGNDGAKGTFTGGAPASSTKSISVASVENTTITSNAFLLNGDRKIGYSVGDNAKAPTSGSLDVVSAGPDTTVANGTEPISGCDPSMPFKVDPTGKALLLKRGFCSFTEKAKNAQAAGAKAVIIYNRDDTTLTPLVDPSVTIPVFIISKTDGLAIQAAVAAGKATITFGPYTAVNPNPQANLISTFSSYGVNADLQTKPDIAAPGGNIWSTYPLEKGKYTNMSGTSMATPHVVGCIALLLQARPEYLGKALAVRDLLQNNATPLLFHLMPSTGLLDSVHVQGAGMINILASIQANQYITPGKLTIGDDKYGKHTQQLTVRNDSAQAVTYTLSNQLAVGTSGDTGNPDFQADPAVVDMPATVTVASHSSATVTVTVHSPVDAVDGEIYGGYISFTHGDTAMHVPYTGMKGDYQSLKVLQDATDGTKLPALAKYDPAQDAVVPIYPAPGEKPVFDFKDNKPGIAFHLEYPIAALKIDAYWVNPAGNGIKLAGNVDTETKMGRDDSYLSLLWNGKYTREIGNKGKQQDVTAKTGDYYFVITVQKAYQDASEAPVYETWKSPIFHVNAG